MRIGILAFLLVAAPAQALNEGLQCVPYARALTGVEIRGDAHSWWAQAEGRYQRGAKPKVGAVMAFVPHGNMRLGHVAAVRKIVNNRTLLISHANWSTIGGARGHIENDVMVVDASEANDWSRVRVWYSPTNALGGTEWPLRGFIYPAKVRSLSEGNKAVVSLLGYAPKPSVRPSPPTVAQVAKPKPSTFALSPALLAEIDMGATNETKRAAVKPKAKAAAADPIMEIIANLPPDERG
jgi:hypothetical protein